MAGKSGRLYLSERLWVPQAPFENLNKRMAEWFNSQMPALPAEGEVALGLFPKIDALCQAHDTIKQELAGVLALGDDVPELKTVHPRDDRISSAKWRTYIMSLWGVPVPDNVARCPATYAAASAIPGVHSVLFSILAPNAVIPPHIGWAAGVVRVHYPLVVPTDWQRCTITVEDKSFAWREGVPFLFDDTRLHGVTNETDEPRVVLIVDFEPPFPAPLKLLSRLRYSVVRRTREISEIADKATVS